MYIHLYDYEYTRCTVYVDEREKPLRMYTSRIFRWHTVFKNRCVRTYVHIIIMYYIHIPVAALISAYIGSAVHFYFTLLNSKYPLSVIYTCDAMQCGVGIICIVCAILVRL